MFHQFPYTDFHELNLDYLFRCCGKGLGLKLDVQGDYLRLVNSKDNSVVSQVKVHYADTALTDVDGNPIKSYILTAGTSGDYIIFTHGDGQVTSLTVPFANKAKYDIDNHEIEDYVYNVQVAGDKVRITKGDGTITDITIPFATKAATDINDKDLTTYAASLAVEGTNLVLRDSLGRELNRITVAYATSASTDDAGNEIKSSYGSALQAGTTTVKLIAKDGTQLSEITVPFATHATTADSADFATLAEDANNAVESVTIVGDQMIFTTFDGAQFTVTCPYAVKANKDDIGNIIKNTYVADVTQDTQTGEISFLDALGNEICSLVPTSRKATYDSYENLIADYVKTIVADNQSDYVTITHGTGATDSIKINYSEHAYMDTNDQVIKNYYITWLTCVEDVDDGHYKIVMWNGDIPRAEIGRFEVWAYKAQVDVNERALTSYVGDIIVDEDDDTKIDVLDGENTPKNVIAGQVTTEPSGTISASASGTAVTLTSGTLPSKSADSFTAPSLSYNAVTEALTFNAGSFTEGAFSAGAFPTVDTVTDPTIAATFTGDSATDDVHFTDSQ